MRRKAKTSEDGKTDETRKARRMRKKNEKKTEREKVEERREEVLAKGRKFKYPAMWTRHRVVISAIVVAVITLVAIAVGGWVALYKMGNTGSLLFNVTKVLPLSVAKVDGEAVRFSDYLTFYRSAIISAQKQSGGQLSSDADTLENRYKRAALTEVEKYVLAAKMARESGITVSDEEVAKEFQRHLKIGGVDRSEEGFVKIIEDNFGLTKSEYERMLYLTLVRAKVEQKNDAKANETALRVETELAQNGRDYQKTAEVLGEAVQYEDTGGLVDSKNIDGGRATVAIGLEPGQESGRFLSMNGDGFYFVKLINKTDAEVDFVSIKVPFTEFEEKFREIQEGGKVTELIKIE